MSIGATRKELGTGTAGVSPRAGAGRSRDRPPEALVTNAVKHFKFVPCGKIRLHQQPNSMEIKACRPWLTREIDLVQPDLIVALGATAVASLFGRAMPINKNRGRVIELDERRRAMVTVHPSYLLRLPDEAARKEEYERFVADLRLVTEFGKGARKAA